MLLGAAGSAAAIIGMTESGLYDISVEERERNIRSDGTSMAGRIAVDYAEANLGGVPGGDRGADRVRSGAVGKTGWLYGVFNPALAGLCAERRGRKRAGIGGAEKI